MENYHDSITYKIKARLLELDLTQADLANSLGITSTNLNNIIHGRSYAGKYAEVIAAALNLTKEDEFKLYSAARQLTPLGIYIKRRLIVSKMSQKELGKRCGITDLTMNRVLRDDRVAIKYTEILAKNLDISSQEIRKRIS